MLTELPYELQWKIFFEFLRQKPTEIIALYDLIKEMMKYTNPVVDCDKILSDKEIKWFESKNIKLKLLEEYKIDTDGTQKWTLNGRLHRDVLPAVIYPGLGNVWYKNGLRHREGKLPAVELLNGYQEWYENGHQVWYIDGVKYTKYGDLPHNN